MTFVEGRRGFPPKEAILSLVGEEKGGEYPLPN